MGAECHSWSLVLATRVSLELTLGFGVNVDLKWTPHPAIVTIRENMDYIRVLLYSYYATIAGWGVLLI